MASHKHIDGICIGIVVFTLLLTILFMNGEALGITIVAAEENSGEFFTARDLDGAWDSAGATRIVLSDGGSTIEGNGAYGLDGDIYIVYPGKYVLSGALTNGKVVVDAGSGDKVWLLLDGVQIHCDSDAAIRIEQAGKVFLTLKEGTKSALSSGETYSDEAVAAKVDGTIYSRDDVTINGGGSLEVMASYRHGIVCNDDFVITGGTVSVTAAQDGIHAGDSVRLREAAVTVSAGDDGVTVSNDDETAYFYMESGSLSIPACYEGVEASQVTVAGGAVDIVSTDDGINASGYGEGTAITISGGEITIRNENGRDADGLDSNRDIFITGGKLMISVSQSSCAIDYGMESGGVCRVSGGTVLACGGSSMAESFDADSPRGFLLYTAQGEAGTEVTLKDAAGDVLLSETVPYRFSSVLASAPGLKTGDECTLVIGTEEIALTVGSSSQGSGLFGGRIPGGNGFGGWPGGQGQTDMQPPEMPTGDTPVFPQDGTENDAAQPPEMPTGDAPIFPQDGTENDAAQPPEMPTGEAPAFPQDGTENGTMRPFGGRPGNRQPQDGGNLQNNAAPQTETAGSTLSAETAVLLAASLAALLLGCTIAFFYKPRG